MTSPRTEAELAEARNDYQQGVYRRRRARSVASVVASSLSAVFTFYQGFETAFVASIAFVLISGLFYFDANGHLHELRRRTRKALVPDFSALDKDVASTEPRPHVEQQAGSHI